MLQNNIRNFLQYCKNSSFSERSIESLTFRLNEFSNFINTIPVNSISEIKFPHLVQFVTDFKQPSVHVKKARIWSLHQFFHYLKLQKLINDNIALNLPYPKIEKKVPQFLTTDEFKLILKHFVQHATTPIGLRNLVIISLLGFLGLRTATITDLNVSDIDLTESRIRIKEKGYQGQIKKYIPLSHAPA